MSSLFTDLKTTGELLSALSVFPLKTPIAMSADWEGFYSPLSLEIKKLKPHASVKNVYDAADDGVETVWIY